MVEIFRGDDVGAVSASPPCDKSDNDKKDDDQVSDIIFTVESGQSKINCNNQTQKSTASNQNKVVNNARVGSNNIKQNIDQFKNYCKDGAIPKAAQDDPMDRQSCYQKLLSCRWKLAYMCFCVRFITGALRQSMSIAILSMVKERNVSTVVRYNGSHGVVHNTMEREFEWNTTFQGFVLSTFNGGAIIAPVLLGYLTRRMSERVMILVCLVMGGISSLVLPPLVTIYQYSVFITRGVMGLSLAGTDNVIQSMWTFWAPSRERASLLSCAYAGIGVSGILAYPLCGLLISLGSNEDGWPNIFYAFGAFTLMLVPLWWLNAFDSPKKHPRIAMCELEFIADDLEHYEKEANDYLPWRDFLTSRAVWAIFVCHLANKLVFSLLLSFLPYYFHQNLKTSIGQSSILSSLPHLGRFLSGIVAGYLSDFMIRRGFSIVATRKTFQGIACFGCALCAILIIAIPHNIAHLSVTLLVLSISLQNVASVAYRINLLDTAPRYAGFLSGLIGSVTNVIALPGPVITSLLLESESGWSTVFLAVAGINIIAGLVFITCAAGHIQDWARSSTTNAYTPQDCLQDSYIAIP